VRLGLVKHHEQRDPLVVCEAVLGVRGHEGGPTLGEPKLDTLGRERPAPLEDEVELVPVVRRLRVRLGSGEDVDPDLEPVGLVDDLVAAGLEAVRHPSEDEGKGDHVAHSLGRVDVTALAVARAGRRLEEERLSRVGGRFLWRADPGGQWISVSSLNMGRYIEMMMTPTMMPTPIIISGSMIDVSVAIELSTSSS
jgi:hypothetical protein